MKEPPHFFCDILKLLDNWNYPAKIARFLNISPRRVRYWVEKAEKQGLIQFEGKEGKGVAKFYRITKYGKDYIDKNFTWGETLVRLHHFAVKYPILEKPRVVVDWKKVGLNNWDRFVGSEFGLRVEMTTKHIIVHADSIRGVEPFEMEYIAGSECDNVARHLESKLQMRLGKGSLMRKPHFAVKDPVAERLGEYYEFSSDLGKVDRSEGHGELEVFDPRFLQYYLELPYLVQKQGRELHEIKGIMQVFGESMHEHLVLVKQLQETTKALREIVEEMKKEREPRSSQ